VRRWREGLPMTTSAREGMGGEMGDSKHGFSVEIAALRVKFPARTTAATMRDRMIDALAARVQEVEWERDKALAAEVKCRKNLGYARDENRDAEKREARLRGLLGDAWERLNGGVGMIATERQRQIAEEGWTPDHDDEHEKDSLAMAAACYAEPDWARKFRNGRGETTPPNGWPWDREWWKPTPDDRIRELVKAGALIAAEIDRLRRTNP